MATPNCTTYTRFCSTACDPGDELISSIPGCLFFPLSITCRHCVAPAEPVDQFCSKGYTKSLVCGAGFDTEVDPSNPLCTKCVQATSGMPTTPKQPFPLQMGALGTTVGQAPAKKSPIPTIIFLVAVVGIVWFVYQRGQKKAVPAIGTAAG